MTPTAQGMETRMGFSAWQPLPDSPAPCRRCGKVGKVERSTWTSYDEAHEDLFYRCRACGSDWIVEGGDA